MHDKKPTSARGDIPGYMTTHADGVTLAIRLQPRSSKSEICGVMGSELRIKVSAHPVESAANAALVRLLSARLGCARGRIQIIRGQTSRSKIVKVTGITARECEELLPDVGIA
jgi:uncharacterized protein (TIGR00251 family)